MTSTSTIFALNHSATLLISWTSYSVMQVSYVTVVIEQPEQTVSASLYSTIVLHNLVKLDHHSVHVP